MCAATPKSRVEGSVEGVEAIKPPRLNFARLCLRCDERDCRSPKCIAWHEASCWMVCPDCDGLCWTADYKPCGACSVSSRPGLRPPPGSKRSSEAVRCWRKAIAGSYAQRAMSSHA